MRQLESDTFEKTTGDAVFFAKTFEKAKNIVIKSIMGNQPKESCVYVMDNQIIHYELGGAHNVELSKTMRELLDNPKNRIAVIHSHPSQLKDGYSAPISYGDFINLNSHEGERSIYAINSLGEYSVLKKIGNARPSIFKVHDFKQLCINAELSGLQEQDIKLIKKHPLFSGKEITEEERKEIEKKAEELFKGEDYIIASRLAIHNFWRENASKLNVQYETNFSCFN